MKYSQAVLSPALQAHARARSFRCRLSRYPATMRSSGGESGKRRAALRSSARWNCSRVRLQPGGMAAVCQQRATTELSAGGKRCDLSAGIFAEPPLGGNDTRIGGFICTGAIGWPWRMSNRRGAKAHRPFGSQDKHECLCHLGVRRASHVNDFVPGDFL